MKKGVAVDDFQGELTGAASERDEHPRGESVATSTRGELRFDSMIEGWLDYPISEGEGAKRATCSGSKVIKEERRSAVRRREGEIATRPSSVLGTLSEYQLHLSSGNR
jgi:hypothetical protein